MQRVFVLIGIALLSITSSAYAQRISCDADVDTVTLNRNPRPGEGPKTFASRQAMIYVLSGKPTPTFDQRLTPEQLSKVKVVDYETFTEDGKRVTEDLPYLDSSKESDTVLAFEGWGPDELALGNYLHLNAHPVGVDGSIWVSALLFRSFKPVLLLEGILRKGKPNFYIHTKSLEAAAIQAAKPGIEFGELIQRLSVDQPFSMSLSCRLEP